MKKWQIQQPDEAAAKNIQANSDLSLFCAELLTVRGYRTIEETASQFSCPALSDPFLIRDMQAAADCLNAAIDSGEKICVYGDYDCDGVMATVILYSYLMELGADVVYYIPERSEGYGMNLNALETLKAQGVSLIVTVDNGIAALEEADWIAEQGMRLVITDHHQPYSTLPAAVAVVDPHRVDCPSPFSLFCGAGLALKLVAAMDGGDMTFALEQFGDLAAIATVADVVSLTGENRFLVQQGLRLLANTERPGLLALLELTGMQGKTLTATNLAFTLAHASMPLGGSVRRSWQYRCCWRKRWKKPCRLRSSWSSATASERKLKPTFCKRFGNRFKFIRNWYSSEYYCSAETIGIMV